MGRIRSCCRCGKMNKKKIFLRLVASRPTRVVVVVVLMMILQYYYYYYYSAFFPCHFFSSGQSFRLINILARLFLLSFSHDTFALFDANNGTSIRLYNYLESELHPN